MTTDSLKNSTLARSLGDVFADFADLFNKEMRLARAEMSEKIATKLQGGVWMAAAGVLALMALFLVLQGLINVLNSFGLAMHWSCFIVAAAVALCALGAFFRGRSDVREDLSPDRTIEQIKQDIALTKEQLS
jgi:hypothetical protein